MIKFFVYNITLYFNCDNIISVISAIILLLKYEQRIGKVNDMKKSEIEKLVSGLLKQYGYNEKEDDYLDIVTFTRSLGFNVGNAKLDANEDGFIMIRPSSAEREDDLGDKVIAVNRDRTFDWKRFIIAHEFAHSVLHYKVGDLYLHRENKKGKNETENDADYFAAALLMPRISFSRKCEELKKTGLSGNALSMQLASTYKVPLESASRRIHEVEQMEPAYGE